MKTNLPRFLDERLRTFGTLADKRFGHGIFDHMPIVQLAIGFHFCTASAAASRCAQRSEDSPRTNPRTSWVYVPAEDIS